MRLNTMRNIFIWLLLGAFVASCSEKTERKIQAKDWLHITQAGKLTVLTENSTLSFFEFKGKRMGFEYEILDTFCKAHGLKLEVKVLEKIEDYETLLKKGEGDIVAANLPVELKQDDHFSYSLPYYQTYQVLVQRKSDSLLREPAYLSKETVYVRKHSAYEKRLKALEQEVGKEINVRYQRNLPLAEDLIEEVASGRINFTLAHENQARVAKDKHPNLDIDTRISFEQRIAFAMRPRSKVLKEKMDAFLKQYITSDAFTQLKKKYFDYIVTDNAEIRLTPRGALSPFDAIFKAAAKKYDWDWKMLAAVAFIESRFNPNARGFGGAYGLMQFMPNTGPRFGVYPDSSPEVQINGGMRYLASVSRRWSTIEDERTRMCFVFASYNAGMGHIEDAQRLAKAAGLDPNLWEGNVKLMVKKLSDPEFYRSDVVRCGAYRGNATGYAAAVLSLYDRWK